MKQSFHRYVFCAARWKPATSLGKKYNEFLTILFFFLTEVQLNSFTLLSVCVCVCAAEFYETVKRDREHF